MIKNITKLVLASFLLTGTASAAELYSGNGNTVNTDIKLQGYLVHDNLGSDQRDLAGGGTAPLEMTGKIDFDTSYYRQVNDQFKVGTVVMVQIYPFGYSNGAFGGIASTVDPDGGDKIGLDKAYVSLEHTKFGTLQLGNIGGTYDDVAGYSDVDIFIGTPATDLPSLSFFGQNHTNGIKYENTFLNNKLTLGAIINPGQDNYPFTPSKTEKNVVLKRDLGFGAKAEYAITEDVTAGLAYQGVYYHIFNNTAGAVLNKDDNVKMSNMATAGLKYAKGSTLIGVNAAYKSYEWSNLGSNDYKINDLGFQAGASYDISGQGVGFRPSVQFDYLKRFASNTPTASGKVETDTVQDMSAELGLSYYVTTHLSYVAAAVFDLRSKDQIKKAQTVSFNNSKGVANDYFGAGVVYEF